MSDTDSFGAFFAGFVIGSLVGAATALILAPQSGEETRAQIQQRGIELQAKAQETLDEARKRADEMITEAQERGRVILEEQRGKLEAVVEEGKRAIEERLKKEEPPAPAEAAPPAEA